MGVGHRRSTLLAPGLLGSVTMIAGILWVLNGVPATIGDGVVGREWTFAGREGLTVAGAIGTLSVLAVMAAATGLSAPTAHVAGAAAALAASWAALGPAIWAETALARALAFAVAGLLPAALLHLSTALLPDTRRRTIVAAAVVAAYVLTLALALMHVLSRNPFLDPGCVVHCGQAMALIPSPELARGTATALRLVSAGLALVSAAVALAAVLRSPGASTLLWVPFLFGCGALEAAWAALPAARAVAGPQPLEFPDLLEFRAAAYLALAVGVALSIGWRVRRRAGLRRMAREMAEVTPPRTIRDVVVARLADPATEIVYYVPSGGGFWIDEHGSRVAEDTAPIGKTPIGKTALIRRAGQFTARITTAHAEVRPSDLEEGLGPAAVIALEAERTRAEQLLRLTTLRAARRQEVEDADAARRRAERDLHDGVQHLLLGATFAAQDGMQLARARGDEAATDLLGRVLVEVRDTARDLREVAHGMYPVLLGDGGLVPALEGLARSAPAPTRVDATPVPRLEPSIELTAYRTAALAVKAAGTREVRIAVDYKGATLTLTAHGARPEPPDLQDLTDRTQALGGTMETMDGSLRLEMPCG